MTREEAFSLLSCPLCGGEVMHVKRSGLVACVASIKFVPCNWNIRFLPTVADQKKKGKK